MDSTDRTSTDWAGTARPGPIAVAAFEGWNDAADAATGVVEHLALTGRSVPHGEIASEEYYDYQVNRPVVRRVGGVTRGIEWPVTNVTRCVVGGRELLLVHGIEPNLRWQAFCRELVDMFLEARVEAVVTLGALLADTPHTRPVPLTGSAPDGDAARRHGLASGDYEGPAGIAEVLQDACVRAGVPCFTLLAAVPHYLSQPPNPKAMIALLERLSAIVAGPAALPLGDLPRRAREWQRDAAEMTSEDDDIMEYVRTLEERADEESEIAGMMEGVDADGIAAEFERYLRGRGAGD